jgi:tetratricopeptide (TPR) repeat protein
MTNPHTPSPSKLLALPFDGKTFAQARYMAVWAFGLMFGLASHTTHAQSVEALEWQPGQSMTTKIVISTPHNDVRKLLRQAKYSQALLLVNKALATNPRDPQMRFWQGFIFEQLGQPDMALQVYLDLTREYPELAEPFNNLGVLYAAKGDYPNAKAALDNALRANPNYAAAHENMGDLLVNMARQSYERSLMVDPKQRAPAQKIERLTPLLNLTQDKP